MPKPFNHYEIKRTANSKHYDKLINIIEESFFNNTQQTKLIDNQHIENIFKEILEYWCSFDLTEEKMYTVNVEDNSKTDQEGKLKVQALYASLRENKY